MEVYFGFILFLLGLCVGSFVNMLKYRTAERYGVRKSKSLKIKSRERSFCDFCGRQLNWYENIPVFSWIFLGGKTKCCHKKLPVEYPLVELSVAILFVVNGYKSPVGLVIIPLLVFSFVFDLKYMILPDFSTFILIALSLIYWQNWLSAIGAGLFLLALHVGTKGRGLGMGDVKFAVFMGLFLGWPKIIIAFYFAFIVGAMVGVALMMAKKAGRKTMIPFGPFLIGGVMIAWWFGDLILKSVKLML